jgi:predicted 3-demethylubiquinone-9 3-methyltransferase (glyoxalase superfamily)
MAMGREHPFSFTLAMSLFVDRDCQDELDPLHSKLVESDPSSCHSRVSPQPGFRWV